MTLLTKQQILDADDIKTQDVDVPEWGGSVRVRAFSAKVRDQLMIKSEQIKKESGELTLPALKLAACVLAIVDEAGAQMFTDAEMQDLGNKSARALDRVYAIAEKLNAVSPEVSAELEKN